MPVEDDDIVECIPVKHEVASSLGKQDTDIAQDIEAPEAIEDREQHFAIHNEYNDQYLSSQLMENPATDQGNPVVDNLLNWGMNLHVCFSVRLCD